MFYLPRICEHCLNPSCVASCPSGAMYKREEDGIVLVDQAKCRGWRFCVSGCPYKKVYFNHRPARPRSARSAIRASRPACRRSARRPAWGASATSASCSTTPTAWRRRRRCPTSTICSTRSARCSSTRRTRPCASRRARDGIPDDWIEAARRSPVYALAHRYRVALPLHPEYRTLPMVWYVPPLSPIVNTLEEDGYEADPDQVFPAIDAMRIPVDYLANLLAAGDSERDPRRSAPPRRDARPHAKARGAGRARRGDARRGGHERGGRRGHVPAAGDRQVRRPLRDPPGARRAGRPADGAAGHLRPRLRGRSRQLRRDRPRHGRRDEAFMLTEDEPTQLDIVQMLGERRRGGGSAD